MNRKQIWRWFRSVSLVKTLFFNLTYFPLRTALKFPVFVSKYVDLYCTEGEIEIPPPTAIRVCLYSE